MGIKLSSVATPTARNTNYNGQVRLEKADTAQHCSTKSCSQFCMCCSTARHCWTCSVISSMLAWIHRVTPIHMIQESYETISKSHPFIWYKSHIKFSREQWSSVLNSIQANEAMTQLLKLKYWPSIACTLKYYPLLIFQIVLLLLL